MSKMSRHSIVTQMEFGRELTPLVEENASELSEFTEYRRGHREMILNAPSIESLERMVSMLVPGMSDRYLRRCKLAEMRARARLNENK